MGNITNKQMMAKPGATNIWHSEVAIWGHGSLVGRITPRGERLFYFRYKNSRGERVTLPIGNFGKASDQGAMPLADARQKAMGLAALHKEGIKDIREHLAAKQAALVAAQEEEIIRIKQKEASRQAQIQTALNRQTVSDLFEHWAKIDLINRKDKGTEVRRIFEKDVLPAIGHIAVEDIKKGDIVSVADELLARGVNRLAKMTFSLMRQMFRFAVDRDLIVSDPTASIRKSKIGGKDVERDRVLSDEEIVLLAESLPNAGLLKSTEVAIWIVLSTCCRIGELLTARWEHLDFENKQWVIPSENSKNGRTHTVHLSQFSLHQFRALRALNGLSCWCYPSNRIDGPVCSKTITKQISDRQRRLDQQVMTHRSAKPHALLLPGGKWTPHDLRRTGATIMTALGILPEVAERCLNHTEQNKVKRIYQRHSYDVEMKEAWSKFGNHLTLILKGK